MACVRIWACREDEPWGSDRVEDYACNPYQTIATATAAGDQIIILRCYREGNAHVPDDPGEARFTSVARKVLRDAAGTWNGNESGQQTFILTDESSSVLQTRTVKASDLQAGEGNYTEIQFVSISYGVEDVGEHHYSITEGGAINGVQNDPVSPRTLTVTVEALENGELSVTGEYSRQPQAYALSQPSEDMPEAAEFEPTIHHVLEGEWDDDEDAAQAEVEFRLVPDDEDAPMPEEAAFTLNGAELKDAQAAFGPVSFSADVLEDANKMVFQYTFEGKSKTKGLIVEPEACALTVTVERGEDGALTVTGATRTIRSGSVRRPQARRLRRRRRLCSRPLSARFWKVTGQETNCLSSRVNVLPWTQTRRRRRAHRIAAWLA